MRLYTSQTQFPDTYATMFNIDALLRFSCLCLLDCKIFAILNTDAPVCWTDAVTQHRRVSIQHRRCYKHRHYSSLHRRVYMTQTRLKQIQRRFCKICAIFSNLWSRFVVTKSDCLTVFRDKRTQCWWRINVCKCLDWQWLQEKCVVWCKIVLHTLEDTKDTMFWMFNISQAQFLWLAKTIVVDPTWGFTPEAMLFRVDT